MALDNGKMDFRLGIDLAQLNQDVKRANDAIAGIGTHANKTFSSMSNPLNGIGSKIAAVFSVGALAGFAQQVISTRIQIDSLERSFTTLLNSAEKGREMTAWIKEFAAVTPLTMDGLAGATQTMLSFGIEAEKTKTYLKAIGDISLGDSYKLQHLSLAFAQMSATGKLMGQDLLQMINAGFNPLAEISRKTGESVGSLKARMNEIPLEEVQNAFISATQAGGKFHNALKDQAEGLAGVRATLRDTITTELNALGEKYEDLIKGGFNATTTVVKSLSKIEPLIRELIVAYGIYRASLILVMATEKAAAMARLSRIKNLRMSIMLLKQLNSVMAKNKYAIIAGLIVSLGFALYKFTQRTDEAAKAQEDLKKSMSDINEKIEEQRGKAEELVGVIRDNNETNYHRKKAFEQLISIYPELLGKLDLEKLKTMELTDAIRLLNEERDKSVIKEYEAKKKELEDKLFKLETQGDGKFTFGDVKKAFGGQDTNRDDAIKATIDEIAAVQKRISLAKEEQRVSKLSSEEKVSELNRRKEANRKYIEEYKKQIDELTSEESTKLYGELTEQEKKHVEHLRDNIKGLEQDIASVDAQIENLTKKPEKKQADEKEQKKQADEAKKLRDMELKDRRAYEDMLSESISNIIELEDDGYKREQMRLEEAHRLKLQKIERQREDLKLARADNGKKLSEAEIAQFDKLKEEEVQIFKRRSEALRKEEIDANQRSLDEYADYFRQRQIIEDGFAKKSEEIKRKAKANGVDAEPYLASLAEETENTLNQIDRTFAEKDASFRAWAGNIANMGIQALEIELVKAKAELKKLKDSGDENATELAKAGAMIKQLEDTIADVNAKSLLEPEKTTIERWQELYKTIDIASQSFEKIGNEIGGAAGKVLKNVGEIAGATISAISGITTLVNNSANAMAGVASAGAKAISTVEKASIILAVVSAGLQIAMKIASMFDKDKGREEQIDRLQSRISSLRWELSNIDTLRLEDAIGKPFEAINKAVEESNKLIRINSERFVGMARSYGLFNAIAIRDNIQLEEGAKSLAKVYTELDYTTTKALSSRKFDGARQEIENISKQTLLLQKQMQAEQSKKKSDAGKVGEYEQAIRENATKMANVINDALEKIMGGSAENMAKQLGDALITAFAKGENAAEAWHSKVRDIVNDITRQMLISKLVEEPIGAIFDKYKKDWYTNDGDFKGIDAVIKALPNLAVDMNSAGGAIINALQNLDPAIKNLITSTESVETNREASKKGIATASQDSVDELNGRATAIQGHTYTISEQTKMLASITNQILQHVAGIHANTNRLEPMERDIRDVKSAIEEMNIKGIKMR